ncbi:MAG: metallophosphoesterase family protein [Chloroflexi bacterium]|nr:metallophosphoesterase family protein [Chloroflexota bacterium]
MRIGFISDIHGNFTALEAVLTDIKKQNIDQLICLGDTVSLGPQPREVLDALREWNAITIMGNHDQATLEPQRCVEFEITEHLIPDLFWGREQLSKEDLQFIGSFEAKKSIRFSNELELLAYHGSPKATTHLVLATTPTETLDNYFNGQTASVFIGGHSHIQMQRRYGNKLFLNSGSVGNAFKFAFTQGNPPSLLPWAEYAIVEQNGVSLHADMRRVYFDTNALIDRVKASDLPGAEWWLQQYQDK